MTPKTCSSPLVPCSSQAGGRPAGGVLVPRPHPYGDEHTDSSPTTTTQTTTPARPRDEHRDEHNGAHTMTTWHYPNPDHPSTRDFPHASRIRRHPCPHCGAPPGASCITKRGTVYDGNHKARARAAGGAR